MANSNTAEAQSFWLLCSNTVACTPDGQMKLLELTLTGPFRMFKLSTTRSFHQASQRLTPSLNPMLQSVANKSARAAVQSAKGATIFPMSVAKTRRDRDQQGINASQHGSKSTNLPFSG
ncbi:TPA: hypothetical protein ACH3X1_003677 [Trebouxia sp. C0004]